ncbi:hypothetical protein OO7_02136 [Providencia sneebia DSM 19967]|uniref:Fimbrial protein n=2 Tax=Providencia sneebia TaxID=516075 RepID=K8WJT5_9GAMM|nr:hypothetical protein OO7_02136 [Providencia sneebia DSM 19967]
MTPQLFAEFPVMELITWDTHPALDFTYYAPEKAYGITLVNENDSNNKIVLLINGTFSGTYYKLKNQHSVLTTSSVTLKNSKVVSKTSDIYLVPQNNVDIGPFSFGLKPRAGADGFFDSQELDYTGTITSFSAYAPSKLKKGRFFAKDRLIMIHRVNPYSGVSSDLYKNTFIEEYQDLGVFVIDTCQVSSITNTNIDFGTQLAGTYQKPTSLANALAQLNVSCVNRGSNYFISIKPNNMLDPGNHMGMTLAPVSGNAEDLPYIATSIGTDAKGDKVCEPNSSKALDYTESKQLVSTTGKNFVQGLNFALCVNGKIAPGGYRGSLDVSFLVE